MNTKNNKFIYFILIILIMFVFIILSEVIIVKKYLNRDKSYETSLFNNRRINDTYDTTNLTYVEKNLDSRIDYNMVCEDICNIKVTDYYFIVNKRNDIYTMSIVHKDKLITTKELGNDISNLYIDKYIGNIYFYNTITTDSFTYDYLLMINEENITDEFISLEANEMEITDNGIIYYYDSCSKHDSGNAYKVKAIRKPFSKLANELNKESKSYPWCSN